MLETWVQSLCWEDPLEKGRATHSSILAWGIPWMEEPGGLQSIRSQRAGHDWETKYIHTLIPEFTAEGARVLSHLGHCFMRWTSAMTSPGSNDQLSLMFWFEPVNQINFIFIIFHFLLCTVPKRVECTVSMNSGISPLGWYPFEVTSVSGESRESCLLGLASTRAVSVLAEKYWAQPLSLPMNGFLPGPSWKHQWHSSLSCTPRV